MSSFANKKVATAATLLTTTSANAIKIAKRRHALKPHQPSSTGGPCVDSDSEGEGTRGRPSQRTSRSQQHRYDSPSPPPAEPRARQVLVKDLNSVQSTYFSDKGSNGLAYTEFLRMAVVKSMNQLSGTAASGINENLTTLSSYASIAADGALKVFPPPAQHAAHHAGVIASVAGPVSSASAFIGPALSTANVAIRFSQMYQASVGMTDDNKNYIFKKSFFDAQGPGGEDKLITLWRFAHPYVQPTPHQLARKGQVIDVDFLRAVEVKSEELPANLKQDLGQTGPYYRLPVKAVVALCALELGGVPMAQFVYELNNPEPHEQLEALTRMEEFLRPEAQEGMYALIGFD